MLRLSQLKLPLDHGEGELAAAVCRRLRLRPEQLGRFTVVKRSVDARRHDAIALVYSLDLELAPGGPSEEQLLRRCGRTGQLKPAPDSRYQLPITPANASPGSASP